MNSLHTGHPVRRLARRAVLGLTAGTLATGGIVGLTLASSAPAQAAPTTIADAAFTWDFNNEATSGAYAPGTWNLMSAGKVGDPGSGGNTLTSGDGGATWSNAAPAGWSARSGDVAVEDLQAGGSYAPATFATTRTNTLGVPANVAGVRGESRLTFSNGVGTVDPATNTATISWDGDATLLFYSGMTFFYVSDPELSVAADGTGTVTATAGGYATDMDDPTTWTALPDSEVVLATLVDVDVTATGVSTTPSYAGVEYAAPEGATAQNRANVSWGSFPTSFVNFQQTVGQGSYWYSSGGAADSRKTANALAVAYTPAPVPAVPTVTVSETSFLPSGEQQVTVSGTGFDPAAATGTRPPLAGKPGGAYVAFGRYADVWKPSAGAPSTARRNVDVRWAVTAADMAAVGGAGAGAVELTPEGTFTTVLTVDKAAADALSETGSYGIYTYPGSGAVHAPYETYTPITFDATVPTPEPPTPELPTTAPVAPAAPAPAVQPVVQPVQAATSAAAKVTRLPTRQRAGRVKLTVSTAGVDLGTAKITLRTAQGKVVKKIRAAELNGAGVARVSLPRLARGTYKVVAVYAGSASTAGSRTNVVFRVK